MVEFVLAGRGVFVADPNRQDKIFSEPPFVLGKTVEELAAHERGRARRLEVVIGQSQEEIGEAVLRSIAVESDKAKVSIHIKIEVFIELESGISAAKLEGVRSPSPGEGVGIGKGVSDQGAWPLRVEPKIETGVEIQIRRPGNLIGGD